MSLKRCCGESLGEIRFSALAACISHLATLEGPPCQKSTLESLM